MSLLPIKVCGMRDKENILSLSSVAPAFLGFIFYEASKRYVGSIDAEILQMVPQGIHKVGVFVNSKNEYVLHKVQQYKLDYVQLHGDESPGKCEELQKEGLKIIKAFSLDEDFDFEVLEGYKAFVSYFLFDTKGKEYGGNGVTFNWEILDQYTLDVPFFLSGGLDLQHIEKIKDIKHKRLFALDLNSRFEIEPGLKDLEKLKTFTKRLRE